MTIHTILQGDIPALRQISHPVISFDENLRELLENLTDTLKAHRGLGLSAPQIGVHQRVIIVDIGQGAQAFVNPEIISTSGELERYESCLSFPDYTLKIARPESIMVEAQNELGEAMQIQVSDLLARVICHEIDHLNGVLFIDLLSDEEMFTQLLGNSVIIDEDTDEDHSEIRLISNDEQMAILEELQLSIDMLSELSWKLALSLEIIKDYENQFEGNIAWNHLREVTDVLDQTIDTVESYVESKCNSLNGGSGNES